MIKILDSKQKNFDIVLDKLLLQRKNNFKSNSFSVIKIINDVKKMVIKLLLNMKKDLIIIILLFQEQKKLNNLLQVLIKR